ncbi:flippase-like domain-containing protein [Marivibrio halodurans]|uniref:Flippase-like domain-containing protein n=1 Tax=Marivibrio halodurans TaxID=2039722 RepID=A0A8J7SPI1_9PROT|nr:lysylphosphatidylglycerol synthase transmembrane domain-containing protein [Marivibrio halodurans]MBP5858648.1 flippase-like domain-containing protein [Marivibrio halodurans]
MAANEGARGGGSGIGVDLGPGRRPFAWTLGAAGSVLLLVPVVSRTDWSALAARAGEIAPGWLALGIALMGVEGVCASLRLHQFARHPGRPAPRRAAAFAANGWYVLAVALFPARLGEAVGMIAMHRLLGLSAGGAAIAILAQRLLDLAVLAGLALPLAFLALVLESTMAPVAPAALGAMGVVALAAVAATLLFLHRPERVLGPAGWLAPALRRRGRIGRVVARFLLQARMWARHLYRHLPRRRAGLLTVAKWGAALGGLWAVLAAMTLPVGMGTLAAITVIYCFVMAVPVPTIGGIGLGEAGLTAMLGVAGVPLAEAAAASLLLRAVLLGFPPLYAGATWFVTGPAGGAARAGRGGSPP